VLIQLATNCAEKVVIQWNEKVEAGEQRDSIPGQFLKLLINAPAAKEALLKSLTKKFHSYNHHTHNQYTWYLKRNLGVGYEVRNQLKKRRKKKSRGEKKIVGQVLLWNFHSTKKFQPITKEFRSPSSEILMRNFLRNFLRKSPQVE
jgi:hypothetical protein